MIDGRNAFPNIRCLNRHFKMRTGLHTTTSRPSHHRVREQASTSQSQSAEAFGSRDANVDQSHSRLHFSNNIETDDYTTISDQTESALESGIKCNSQSESVFINGSECYLRSPGPWMPGKRKSSTAFWRQCRYSSIWKLRINPYLFLSLGRRFIVVPYAIISRHDSLLRTFFLAFLLSILLSYCCHGYVINKPHPLHRRIKHSVNNISSINSSSSSSSSPSLLSSSSSSSLSSSSSPSPVPLSSPLNVSTSDPTNYSNSTSSNNSLDTRYNSDLAASLISTLIKLQALPISNSSNLCITLDKISEGRHVSSSDNDPFSTSFSIRLSFKIRNPDTADDSSVNDSQNSTTVAPKNESNSANTTTPCISDPKVLLALVLNDDGNVINNFDNPDADKKTSGNGDGSSGDSSTKRRKPSGFYGTLETGNLSRTQVVVISTCSAIIGMFFLSAAFLRIRNYVKRIRFEKANARRKKFRSCSVALRNSTHSSEQLRRESLNSKTSQMNSQTNVSAQDGSTPSSPRREVDTSPLLLVTRASVEPGSGREVPQIITAELIRQELEKEKMRSAVIKERSPSNGNSKNTSRQPSPNGDINHRVGSIPINAACGSLRTGLAVGYPGGSGRPSQIPENHMSGSFSSPKLYNSVPPTQHPQLAKVRGVGLVRASSLGNSRDVKAPHLQQRGSLKLRHNNQVGPKDTPSQVAQNGRYFIPNAFVNGTAGKYVSPKNGMYDNSRIPLERMKSVSFDVDTDYASRSGSGTCLTCNVISKRLDMICHSLKDAQCPFAISNLHRYHPNGGGGNHHHHRRDMTVEASLNNAGAALSFPILATKDVNKNLQPLMTGGTLYPSVFPSSTSSSPGESGSHSYDNTTSPQRISTSVPTSRQNLHNDTDMNRDSCQNVNQLEETKNVPEQPNTPSHIIHPYKSTNSHNPNGDDNDRNETGPSPTSNSPTSNYDSCDNSNEKNDNASGSSTSHRDSFDSEAGNYQSLDSDTSPHRPLQQQPSTSPPENSSVCDSALQTPAETDNTQQRSICTPPPPSSNKHTLLCPAVPRLTRSNEDIQAFSNTLPNENSNAIVNVSLPCISIPSEEQEVLSQTPQECYNKDHNSSENDDDGDLFVSLDNGRESPPSPEECENVKPPKLSLFPNHRRLSKKYEDTEDDSQSKPLLDGSQTDIDNDSSSEYQITETAPDITTTTHLLSTSCQSLDNDTCGVNELPEDGASQQEASAMDYLSQSSDGNNDSSDPLSSPESPPPMSETSFLLSTNSSEYSLTSNSVL